jgi:hypothetical protein
LISESKSVLVKKKRSIKRDEMTLHSTYREREMAREKWGERGGGRKHKKKVKPLLFIFLSFAF